MRGIRLDGARDGLLVLLSSIVMRLGALFASIIASRTVSMETLAEITTLLFGYQTFASIAVGGFLPLVTKKIAASKDWPRALALNIDALYRVTAILAVISVIGFFAVLILFIDNLNIMAALLFGAATFLNVHFHKFQASQLGFSGFSEYSKGNIVFSAALLVSLPAMWVWREPWACAASYFFANAAATTYARMRVTRRVNSPAIRSLSSSLRRRYLKSIGSSSVKLLATNMFIFPSLFILSLSLNRSALPLQTSTFNILMQWRSVLSLVPGAVTQAHLPRLSGKTSDWRAKWSRFLLQYVIVSTLSLGGFYFGGKFLLSIYNAEIANNKSAITALSVAMLFTLINACAGQYLFLQKRYKVNLASNAVWVTILLAQVFFFEIESATIAISALALAAISQSAFLTVYLIVFFELATFSCKKVRAQFWRDSL